MGILNVLNPRPMKVAFFGQSGPYAPVALRVLLGAKPRIDIDFVVEGRKLPMSRLVHRWLAPATTHRPTDDNLAEVATAAGLEVLQTADVNADYVAATLRHRGIDVLVCVGFDRLFDAPLLAAPRRFAINAHPSYLPALRGPSPLFWALRYGASETAMSLHAMDTKEDHGVIYAQAKMVIPPRISGEALYQAAGSLAGSLLQRFLIQVSVGDVVGVPQDDRLASRAPRPRAEDTHVDPPAWDCTHLVNFACGAPYFRAPWMTLGGETFHIREGLHAEPGRRMPGQYVLRDDVLIVACRDGLAHLRLQT